MGALENTMRCTVRKEIQEAVAAYEDKPRDQWLFDYPAQVSKDQKLTHNGNKGLPLHWPKKCRKSIVSAVHPTPYSFSNM